MAVTLNRGFVIDVISNPIGLTSNQKLIEQYESMLTRHEVQSFPPNSVIAKIFSSGEAKAGDQEIICFPFFSSHLQLPVKPGEAIWIVFEDNSNRSQIGYWLSRIPAPGHLEDANYTFFTSLFKQNPEFDSENNLAKAFGDIESSEDIIKWTGASPSANAEEIHTILGRASQDHRFEAVPRIFKRPGDLVLQGSNNASICIGEIKGHCDESAYVKTSATKQKIKEGQAAIDIVVGRGKISSTAPVPIATDTGKITTKKDKESSKETEGDAHFKYDAARFLLCEGLEKYDELNIDNLLDVINPEIASQTVNHEEKMSGSFAVAKADNIRFISRSNGSVKIIKEAKQGSPGAGIILSPDGTVHISGKQIYLTDYNGSNKYEPSVKHSELMVTLAQITTQLLTVAQTLQVACAAAVESNGAPIASLASAATILQTSIVDIQKTLVDVQNPSKLASTIVTTT